MTGHPTELRDVDPLDPCPITHPARPLVDDESALVIHDAAVELTLLRAPMALGDSLADLHAMVSLIAQIKAWLPIVVAGARSQRHSWDEIANQLEVTPATARRRHRAHLASALPDAPD